MSTNEHLDAIRKNVNWLRRDIEPDGEDDLDGIIEAAEALAAELEAERARVLRWKRLGLAYLHDPQEYASAWDDLRLHGDLPDEEV